MYIKKIYTKREVAVWAFYTCEISHAWFGENTKMPYCDKACVNTVEYDNRDALILFNLQSYTKQRNNLEANIILVKYIKSHLPVSLVDHHSEVSW